MGAFEDAYGENGTGLCAGGLGHDVSAKRDSKGRTLERDGGSGVRTRGQSETGEGGFVRRRRPQPKLPSHSSEPLSGQPRNDAFLTLGQRREELTKNNNNEG